MASIQQPPNNMAAANPNIPGNPNLPGELTPQRLQEVFQVTHPITIFLPYITISH
jgi:hypothetical protein